MFVKTQTIWALIRVNYLVLDFRTKKKVFNPIIEKFAIIEKSVALIKNVHILWLISLMLMKLKLNAPLMLQ